MTTVEKLNILPPGTIIRFWDKWLDMVIFLEKKAFGWSLKDEDYPVKPEDIQEDYEIIYIGKGKING